MTQGKGRTACTGACTHASTLSMYSAVFRLQEWRSMATGAYAFTVDHLCLSMVAIIEFDERIQQEFP